MKYCFGVDIGGTTVKMGLFEATGTILEKWEIKTHTEEEGKAILPDVAASLKEKKAPRCRLIASWGCIRSQGFGCSLHR